MMPTVFGKIIDWPALIVALIVAAYWARVVQMARKMRRRTGRAANFVPAERTGRLLRTIWQPVVWIWVGHPFVIAFCPVHASIMTPLFNLQPIRWTAVAGAAAAFAATRVCWRKMGKSWRMGIDPDERTPLIVTGPYAYVRHPIYALSNLLMICTMIIVPTPLMIVTGMLHLFLLQWETRREERYLENVHGEPYQRYCSAVGRFLPRAAHPYTSADV